MRWESRPQRTKRFSRSIRANGDHIPKPPITPGGNGNGRFRSTPVIENSEPNFRKGPEGGVCERPKWIGGKIHMWTAPSLQGLSSI